MIELYIAGYKADTTTDLEIPMTYENISLGAPEAVKNNYSKTVKLQGTKNNNKIFGQIYRLDRNIIDSTSVIGINFNPNKRVEYYIKYDGSLYDRGYFKLDSIENNNHVIQYNLTLYGGLGNFFYNLMYNDDEESALNLGSLYYGIDDKTKEQENRISLFEFNAQFVKKAWEQRCSNFKNPTIPYKPNLSEVMFCPIHLYNGYYDDFDSNKVLINTEAYPQDKLPFKLTETYDNLNYIAKKNWVLVETPRNMTEDEIQDIRSHYQRLGIRLQNIYDAIKNPDNNGGYEVDDSAVDDIQKAYIENGYLMLKQFNWTDINTDFLNTTIRPQWDMTPINIEFGYNYASSSKFNVSEYLNPNMQVCVLPELQIYWGGNTTLKEYTTKSVGPGGVTGSKYEKQRDYYIEESYAKDWLTYYFVVGYKGSTKEFTTQIYIYGGGLGTGSRTSSAGDRLKEEVENYILNKFKLQRGTPGSGPSFTEFNYSNNAPDYSSAGRAQSPTLWRLEETQDEPNFTKWLGNYIRIQVPITNNTTKTRVYSGVVAYDSLYLNEGYQKSGRIIQDNFAEGYPIITDKIVNYFVDQGNREGILKPNAMTWSKTKVYISDTEGYVTQIYDGDISLESDRHILNKKAIFHDTPSPYEFLINLSRMFNWKFISDNIKKKIYIYSSKKYYQNYVQDIESKLDFSKYTITPSTAEHKYYSFEFDQSDTYAKKLWESKYGTTYGMNFHKTQYEFAKDKYNILEDCKFKQVIPWKLHSIYFNRNIDGWPTPTLGNKYTVTLFNNNESKDFTHTGYLNTTIIDNKKSISQNEYDAYPKLCSFDSDFSPVDNDNCIVFHDYLMFQNVNNDKVKNVQVSDNIEICKELNDNNCYYLCNGLNVYAGKDSTQKTQTSYVAGAQVPCFSNKFLYNNQLYFYSYKDEKNDITLQSQSSGITTINNLYDLYFRSEYTDMYDKNAKIIKIKYKLTEDPKDAMRHFYKFNNCIWLLNKITNYSPKNHNYVECEFMKINNINNYTE